MQGTIQKYVLDMAEGKKNGPLRVKQYDTNSRWASISLTAFGEPWPVPAGCRACIAVKKTDGTSVLNDCTIEDSNTVIAPITDQTTAVQGIQQAELYFLAVDGDIKSQTFPINVYPAIMDQRAIESSDEFGTLQTAIIGAQEATRTAQDAASEAMVQAGEARDAAEIAMDAAASLDVAVQAAAAAKTSETNAKASETAAAQSKADVEAMKAAFAGYDKTESGRKYANSLTNKISGTDMISVKDAWEAPVVNLEVDGASEQVVTTGAQLFDAKTIVYTNNVASAKDISQTVTGVKFTTAAFNDSAGIFCTNPITYSGVCTISCDIIVSSKDFNKIKIRLGDAGTANQIDASEFINNQAHFSMTRELKDDKTLTLYVDNTDKTTPITVEFANIMIAKGNTALPWEPYTGGKPSPSPEYPQEIVSVAHVTNSGSQLFDASRIPTKTAGGATVTNNGDGSFTITGSGTATAVFNDTVYYSAEEAAKLFVKPGKYTLSGGISTPYIALTMAENDVILIDVALPIKDSVSFTVTEDMIEKIKSGAIKVKSGFFSQLDRQLLPGTVKPMLNYDDALPWEPYNGQQREIDLTVESSGKNLFDKSAAYSYNAGAVDIVQLDRGIRISNATSRTYAAAAVKLKLKPYTTYTFSGDITALTAKSTVGIRKSTDGGKSYIATLISSFSAEAPVKGVSRTFTTDENEHYALCLFCTNDVETSGTTTFENIQLEEGNKATAWEPYAGYQSAIIPLTEPLYGIGDVKDRFCMREGVWGIERQFVKIVLDGNENEKWTTNASWTNSLFSMVLSNSKKYDGFSTVADILCDKLKVDMPQVLAATIGKSGIALGSSPNKVNSEVFIAVVDHVDTKNIERFRSWLVENPIEMVYPLAESTWEPFPESTQAALNALTTHPGTTYLTVTSTDIAAPMRLTYVQDTRKVIDSLKLDMAEQMIELQAQIDQLKVTNNLS